MRIPLIGGLLFAGFFFSQSAHAVAPADYGLVEGDLISASGLSDPDIYIVNQYGYKRLFLNPTIFNFYGHLKWENVRNVTSATRDVFVTSGLFRNCEMNDPKVYGVEVTAEDGGTLHWVNITGEQAVAQDIDFFNKVFCINSAEWNWYPKETAYTSVAQIPAYTRQPGTPAPFAGMTQATWISYTTPSGKTVQALWRHPAGQSPLPAVIYNHSSFVEDIGYEEAIARGYDIADFVDALNDAGYAAIAPLRDPIASADEGVDVFEGALQYLQNQTVVDYGRLSIIGYSKGGWITLATALEYPATFKAAVFIAPSPWTGTDAWGNLATTANLGTLTTPIYVALGAQEDNPDIVRNSQQFVADLQALGKDVQSRLDYPGDHNWFREVRPEYWPDIESFLNAKNTVVVPSENETFNPATYGSPHQKVAQTPPSCCNHPYWHQIYRAFSSDGVTWQKENTLIKDHASVPAVVQKPDGTYIVYYVDGQYDTVDCIVSSDGTSFTPGNCTIYGFTETRALDPYIVKVDGGFYRLYFMSPPPGSGETKIMSALSKDGINWLQEEGVRLRLTNTNILDPVVIKMGNLWRLYTWYSQGSPGSSKDTIVSATSTDGLSFTKETEFQVGGGVPEVVTLDSGLSALYFCGQGGLRMRTSTDGLTWVNERSVLSATSPRTIACDPSIIKTSAGWVMYYKESQ